VPGVSVVLLAAGESARMGRQKALLPWQGTTLLEHHLAALASIDDVVEIIVVTGGDPGRITAIAGAAAKTTSVHNAAYRSGKVSSIATGLGAIAPDTDAILLIAVDQPRPAALIRRLLDAHREGRAPITLPARGGRRGHPVIFDRGLLPELLAIAEETKGIRAVLEGHRGDTREVEFEDDAVLLDLNLPSDLPPSAA